MKRKTTLSVALMVALLLGSPSAASAQSYNFEKVDFVKMSDVFYEALKEGKPYPSDAEICALGISPVDLEFIKSHVKRRETIDTENNRLISDTYYKRMLMMNTPMGSGSGGDAGYPTGTWHNDVFSLWNYTSLWGSWNHSVGQIPGSWTDAAHKNGADMQGGTIFFDASHGDNASYYVWKNFATQKDNTPVAYKGFKYVRPLVNMLRYFGMDGLNINWETGSPSESKEFHQALYSYAKEIGFNNFRLTVYTVGSSLSSYNARTLYADPQGQILDLLLNHAGSGGGSAATMLDQLASSAQEAEKASPSVGASALWKGFWIVTMNGDWNKLNANADAKKVNIYLWGEHKNSRFWSYNSGGSTMDQQANYQSFLERAFSGGNRNPLNRPPFKAMGNEMEWKGNTPPLSTFVGYASYIPERSTITGNFPFATNFCLGNGDRYNYRGKRAAGAWYNMGAQDLVPTYRWLVLEEGQTVNESARTSTAIEASFSHEDAYIGGSCLRLTGDASKATDIVLYKTDITPNDANTYATVAIKGGGDRQDGAVTSNLSLILEVNGAWREYKIGDNTGKGWQEHNLKLNLTTADKVTHVGLRVKGGTDKYDMLVGQIMLNDGMKATPKTVSNLQFVKTAETTTTMDLKLKWDVNITPDPYGVAYNCEGNIDHFEILFKDGENGKAREVGRTSQWAAFIPSVDVEKATDPYIGVVAVSKDLKTYSAVEWQKVEKGTNLEENPFGTYGQSSLNVNAEGFMTAIKLRGVERFKTEGATEDIDYQLTYEQYQQENNNGQAKYLNYHRVKDKVLKVRQGQEITFKLKGFDGSTINGGASRDDCRYCFVGGWMDFDGSGTFNYGKGVVEQPFWKPNYAERTDQDNFEYDTNTNDGTEEWGERVFRHGSLRKGNLCLVSGEGLKGTIRIPEDAHVGKSRLRIVYSDAWFAGEFSPTANTNKGYTLDIDVEIEGDASKSRGAKDLHDMGEPEDWTVVTDITEVINTTAEPTVRVENGTLVFANTQKAEIYTSNGMMLKSVSRPHIVYGKQLVKGVYIVRLNGKKSVKVTL